MSTQSSKYPSVTFGITQPFQNIRLLEVPDEVLDIITNSTEGLYLKSSPPTDDSDATREGNLHLCSNKKAWLIKQVSTSNSVYITKALDLQQHHREVERDNEDFMSDGPDNVLSAPTLGITAISKPTSVLELYPVPTTSHENTISELRSRLIPTISTATDPSTTSPYSMQDLYNHIPAPTSIIERVFAQRCMFELPWSTRRSSLSDPSRTRPSSNAKAYTPTSDLLLETWRKVIEAATIANTKITGDLEADMLLEAFGEPSHGNNDDVFKALARKMFESDGYFTSLGLITKASGKREQEQLNEMEMSRWVGNMILKVHAGPNGALEKKSFEEIWEHAVPAAWVKYCSVEVLGTACEVTIDEANMSHVSWRPFAVDSGASPDSTEHQSTTKPAVSAATTKGKRRWHEKFAAQRDAKKAAQ